MRSLIKTILITLLSTTTTIVFADGCTTTGHQQGDNYFGRNQCDKAIISSQLKVNGQLNINGVKVNGDTAINGAVTGQDLWVKGSLIIKGKTTLNKVKVTGSTVLDGQTTLSSADLQNL